MHNIMKTDTGARHLAEGKRQGMTAGTGSLFAIGHCHKRKILFQYFTDHMFASSLLR